MKCAYFPQCNGCSYWDKTYDQQILIKKQDLLDHLKNHNIDFLNAQKIEFISVGLYGLRHRFDFTLETRPKPNGGSMSVMGLYNQQKEVIDTAECLQLSPKLQNLYSEFRQLSFPIKKGSVRLRVSPSGEKGVWLDFANSDIKKLLDEKSLLVSLLNAGFKIEFGQKNKSIMLQNNELKVCEPKPHLWFRTPDLNCLSSAGDHLHKHENLLGLFGFISSFTQPSWISAQAIVGVIGGWINDTVTTDNAATSPSILKIAEFGSGLGQYTLPLLSAGHFVDAFEWDNTACENLKRNCEINSLNTENLRIFHGDFHKTSIESALASSKNKNIPNLKYTQDYDATYDFVLVNPARSGLKKFCAEILKIKPKFIIYVSCFPESLAQDLRHFLKDDHYKISAVTIVDQFPQTKHYETCVFLERY